MARPKSLNPPPYLFHQASGQARVIIHGKTHYLGKHGSPESKEKYNRLVAEYLANGCQLPDPSPATTSPDDPNAITIIELVVRYNEFAKHYYGDEKRGEYANMKSAVRPLVTTFGSTAAAAFTPKDLITVRSTMIAKLCRNVINIRVNRIRRVFQWAATQGLVSATVWHGLKAVEPLKYGRLKVRESIPVKPVADEHVEAVKACVAPQVAAMIELQRTTGMRPGEVVIMRRSDIDTTGELWEYKPARHKTAHHGKVRVIPLGPKARAVVDRFLRPELTAYLFSPIDVVKTIRDARHKARTTPAKQGNRPGTNRRKHPQRTPQERYTVISYAQAVARGCDKAYPPPAPLCRRPKTDKVKGETVREWKKRLTERQREQLADWRRSHRWHPHQLRHTRATELRRRYGLEAAKAAMGHASLDATEIYAEVDSNMAVRIAREVG